MKSLSIFSLIALIFGLITTCSSKENRQTFFNELAESPRVINNYNFLCDLSDLCVYSKYYILLQIYNFTHASLALFPNEFFYPQYQGLMLSEVTI